MNKKETVFSDTFKNESPKDSGAEDMSSEKWVFVPTNSCVMVFKLHGCLVGSPMCAYADE
jgi:hypothetical protein